MPVLADSSRQHFRDGSERAICGMLLYIYRRSGGWRQLDDGNRRRVEETLQVPVDITA